MRAFAQALVLWAVIVAAILFYYPFEPSVLPCMRLVGRSAACEAAQAVLNDELFRHRGLPLLVSVVAGFAGIVLVRLRGRRRQRDSKERLESP